MIVKFVGTALAGVVGTTLIAGCAMPAPRMQELGPNSYMVTVRAQKNADGKKIARQQAMAEAERLCGAQDQYVRATHLTAGVSDHMLGGDVELNFRCQDAPSPEP